jgi:hypothetical protein
MPINLGDGLVTGSIVLRTGVGSGGGGTSVNVPINSILYSSTGTDICGNSDLTYDGSVITSTFINTDYLNGNIALIGDYYYDSTILLLSLGEDDIDLLKDKSFYKGSITKFDIQQSYEDIFNNDEFYLVTEFNGTTSYITATNTIFNIGVTGGTIEFMFKLNDTLTNGTIFILSESGSNEQTLVLQANSDSTGNYLAGGLSLYLVTTGYELNPIWDTSGLNTSSWYYFALSIHFDTFSTPYRVYFGNRNFKKYAEEQIILTPELESYTTPNITIGASIVSENYFNGKIGNLRVTSIERYLIPKIPIPSSFYPSYSIGFNTNDSTFKIASGLRLFIGANDSGRNDIVIGSNTMTFNGGTSNSENIVIGNGSLKNIATANINRNVIIGNNSLINATGTYQLNNIIGSLNIANASTCNILGYNSSTSTFSGCSILGNSATVSGSNQNQIGGSGTTTYTYGAVQDRSDLRDKADIIDIPIGVNFINKLKPKFYRWNYREDYIQYDESGNEIAIHQDETKKRIRFHAGLIAQDVKESMDDLSIDFGVYQDHQVNGGKDIKTLGYAELIPVLIKAVQELSAKNTELENRIKVLEDK